MTTAQIPFYSPGYREIQFCVNTLPKGAVFINGKDAGSNAMF